MQVKPFKPLHYGEISVERCVEHEVGFFQPARMFPLSTPEAVDAGSGRMEPHLMDPAIARVARNNNRLQLRV